MLGSSRTSFDQARAALVARDGQESFDELSEQLLAVSSVLAQSTSLRGSLSDSGRDVYARQELARSVLNGKVGSAAVEVVADVVGRRWTSAADLVDAVEGLGVEAALVAAERAGRIDTVEDELFRVERTVAGDDSLAKMLSDPLVSDDNKSEVMRGILEGRADEHTLRLVEHVVRHPRGRRTDAVLDTLVAQSARRRERLLAKVRVAAAMTDDQQRRLASALGRIYRHEVDLQVEIDPDVRGGVSVSVGDEIIDGTVANRLEQLRRRLGV